MSLTNERELAKTVGSDDVAVFSDILFNIEERPVFIQYGDGKMVEAKGKKALINMETQQMLSVVSDRYQPVHNSTVLAKFHKILEANNVEFKYGRGVINPSGNKTIMELILPKHEIDIRGDKMRIHAYLINDFMGTGAVKLQLGHFRYACTNLALMKGSREINFSASHIGQIDNKLAAKFNEFVFDKIHDTTKFLTDMSQGTFGGTQNIMKFIKEQDLVAERYRPMVQSKWAMGYESSDSYYNVYNAYTDVITHDLKGNEFAKMTALNELNSNFENMLYGSATIIDA
jgi:hypothetical protein